MKSRKNFTKAISGLIVSAIAQLAIAADKPSEMGTAPSGMEKCYGIAKADMNDCGTASHGCSGESKIDHDPEAWLFVPTGLCTRIAGGSTKPPKG